MKLHQTRAGGPTLKSLSSVPQMTKWQANPMCPIHSPSYSVIHSCPLTKQKWQSGNKSSHVNPSQNKVCLCHLQSFTSHICVQRDAKSIKHYHVVFKKTFIHLKIYHYFAFFPVLPFSSAISNISLSKA